MKFDKDLNIVIKCDNLAQVEKVFALFVSDGFCDDDWSQEKQKSIRESNLVRIDCNSIFTMDWEPSNFNEELTYQQFMDKYGMTDLKGKIEEAKNKTHMSLHQLSKAIGFNEHYLSAVVKRNRSESTQKKIITLLDDLIKKSQQELTHDFQGKALNKKIDDAVMISKSEYESMKKEIDHKNQVLDKRNAVLENSIVKVNELENQIQSLQKDCLNLTSDNEGLEEKMLLAEKDSEKWQCDYWTVSRENVELINSKRAISICLAVSILIIVVMLAFGVLHFNGVV